MLATLEPPPALLGVTDRSSRLLGTEPGTELDHPAQGGLAEQEGGKGSCRPTLSLSVAEYWFPGGPTDHAPAAEGPPTARGAPAPKPSAPELA